MNGPIDSSVSESQGGSRKGHTTTGQAIAMWATLAAQEGRQYVCLLDIAKAFPSVPHQSLLQALQAIGAPLQLLRIIQRIYQGS